MRLASAWIALVFAASGCWMRVAPDDPRVRYTGRMDRSDPAGPRFSLTGSAVAVRVESSALRLHLREVPYPYRPKDLAAPGTDRYELLIDGAPAGVLTASGPEWRQTVALGPGAHVVELFKRTEPEVGQGQLLDLELPFGARLLPPPERPERRIELIGDSITTGFGNLGPGPKCLFTAATEDGYRSYAALAARMLRAEAHFIAWGGRGVARNYDLGSVGIIPRLFERTLPEDPASRWDFSLWTPHAVVIFAGQNDFARPGLDIEKFEQSYIRLVTEVRRRYPRALILCAYPSVTDAWPENMRYGTLSRQAMDRVMKALAGAGVTRVKTFVLDHRGPPADGLGCLWHPSLPTHETMAERLRSIVAEAMGW